MNEIIACMRAGYPYFAAQFGQFCFAGTDLTVATSLGLSTECNMPCAGDSSQTCGGPLSNSLYVAYGEAWVQGVMCPLPSDDGHVPCHDPDRLRSCAFTRASCFADYDKCAIDNGGCSPDAVCTDTPTTRTCACKPGYTGDGITCTGAH